MVKLSIADEFTKKNDAKTDNAMCNWIFTLNNYTFKELLDIISYGNFKYMHFGFEIGEENGTPHLQGYFQLHDKKRRETIKNEIGCQRLSLRKAYASAEANYKYCSKQGDIYVFPFPESIPTHKGVSASNNQYLSKMYKMIDEGKTMYEVSRSNLSAFSRNHAALTKYKALADYERSISQDYRQYEVIVHWGDAGTGKTRDVYLQHDKKDIYKLDKSGDTVWWDGYTGQPVLLIDDFYGWIAYNQLLNILDGYGYKMQVKGSHTYAMWNKVYITSNKHPKEWYNYGLTPALDRRLTRAKFYRKTPDIHVRKMIDDTPQDILDAIDNGTYRDIQFLED